MTAEEDAAGEGPWSQDSTAGEMRYRLADLSVAELMARWSVGDEYDDYYELIALALSEQGAPGIEVLERELDGRRVPQIRAALTVLEIHRGHDPEFVEKVEWLAGTSEPLVAGDAIRLLGFLGVTAPEELIRGKLNHPAPFIRAAMLDHLARTQPRSAYPALVRGLADSDHIVRETAVDALDDLGSTDAIASIEPLLQDPDENVRQAARTAVDNLRARADSADRRG